MKKNTDYNKKNKELLFLEKVADKKTSRDEIMFNLINALKKNGWKCDEETNNFQKKYVKKLKENSND
tara:strand:+ start:156 stop:356 length:201 start_codon:yes stop_codon:yes gene_type:complete